MSISTNSLRSKKDILEKFLSELETSESSTIHVSKIEEMKNYIKIFNSLIEYIEGMNEIFLETDKFIEEKKAIFDKYAKG